VLVLIIAILALFIGVAIVPFARKRPQLLAALDGFVIVMVGGILALNILPFSVDIAGYWAIPAALIGLSVPWLIERGKPTEQLTGDLPMLVLAAVGLAVHAFLDGGALATEGVLEPDQARALATSVVVHRLPMGVMLGMLGTAEAPSRPWLGAGLIAVGTVAGFWVGAETLPQLGQMGLALFQALIAGSLVHVIWAHSPSLRREASTTDRRAGVVGVLLGLICLGMVGHVGG